MEHFRELVEGSRLDMMTQKFIMKGKLDKKNAAKFKKEMKSIFGKDVNDAEWEDAEDIMKNAGLLEIK